MPWSKWKKITRTSKPGIEARSRTVQSSGGQRQYESQSRKVGSTRLVQNLKVPLKTVKRDRKG